MSTASAAQGSGGLDAHVVVGRDGFALDVTVAVAPGTTVAVVGPNGAGKSTLVRALAGLLPLDAGHVRLAGVTLDDGRRTFVSPHRRRVGLVPQDGLLLPDRSALANVAYGVRCHGARRSAAEAAARRWLGLVGLEHKADVRPGRLSGGEAQRVALARALALDPALVLLDEPLAALDVTTRDEVRRLLRRHLAPSPAPRVLVTHDAVDVALLADHVIVLDRGRVVQRGSPAELAARPANGWVADLVGVTLLAGRAGGDADAGTVVLDGGGRLVVADPIAPGPVLVAVAPGAVALFPDRPEGSTRNAWPCTVVALEPLGPRVRVHLHGTPRVLAEITPAAVDALGLVVGSEVWAAVKAADLMAHPA